MTSAQSKQHADPSGAFSSRPKKLVAVVDIGSTAVRMAIAEIDDQENVRNLEALTQEVSLGKDTFTRGRITAETTEECVCVLKRYRRLLEEYQITRPEQVRVVATSAVREAENRLAFWIASISPPASKSNRLTRPK